MYIHWNPLDKPWCSLTPELLLLLLNGFTDPTFKIFLYLFSTQPSFKMSKGKLSSYPSLRPSAGFQLYLEQMPDSSLWLQSTAQALSLSHTSLRALHTPAFFLSLQRTMLVPTSRLFHVLHLEAPLPGTWLTLFFWLFRSHIKLHLLEPFYEKLRMLVLVPSTHPSQLICIIFFMSLDSTRNCMFL